MSTYDIQYFRNLNKVSCPPLSEIEQYFRMRPTSDDARVKGTGKCMYQDIQTRGRAQKEVYSIINHFSTLLESRNKTFSNLLYFYFQRNPDDLKILYNDDFKPKYTESWENDLNSDVIKDAIAQNKTRISDAKYREFKKICEKELSPLTSVKNIRNQANLKLKQDLSLTTVENSAAFNLTKLTRYVLAYERQSIQMLNCGDLR